jgi:hypothetical protein
MNDYRSLLHMMDKFCCEGSCPTCSRRALRDRLSAAHKRARFKRERAQQYKRGRIWKRV